MLTMACSIGMNMGFLSMSYSLLTTMDIVHSMIIASTQRIMYIGEYAKLSASIHLQKTSLKQAFSCTR